VPSLSTPHKHSKRARSPALDEEEEMERSRYHVSGRAPTSQPNEALRVPVVVRPFPMQADIDARELHRANQEFNASRIASKESDEVIIVSSDEEDSFKLAEG